MNTTATKKIAFATLSAPILAALAIGLAGNAHADPTGSGSASDTLSSLLAEGLHVVVTKDSNAPLEQCSVVSVRQDHPHQHHGGLQHDVFNTAYLDATCH